MILESEGQNVDKRKCSRRSESEGWCTAQRETKRTSKEGQQCDAINSLWSPIGVLIYSQAHLHPRCSLHINRSTRDRQPRHGSPSEFRNGTALFLLEMTCSDIRRATTHKEILRGWHDSKSLLLLQAFLQTTQSPLGLTSPYQEPRRSAQGTRKWAKSIMFQPMMSFKC